MNESLLDSCRDLCQQAHAWQGSEPNQHLQALAQTLQALAFENARQVDAARVLAQLQEPIITLDTAGYITSWNQGAERLYGFSAEETLGQHILFLYANDEDSQISGIEEFFQIDDSALLKVKHHKKTGEVFWADLSLTVLRDNENDVQCFVGHLAELGKSLSTAEKLSLHASIIANSDQGILITNGQERIVSVNAAFTRITGYSMQEAIGQTTDLLRSGVHDADFRAQVSAALQGTGPWQGEIIGKRKNGELFPQSVSISAVRDDAGQITHAFSIFSDISVLRASEERMQQLVNYDSLTGLPNRTLFNQLLGQALATARRNNDCCVVLALELNRLSTIKETFGNEVADELLRQVGHRWRTVLRDEDVLARVGDAEFVAVLTSIQKREHSGIVSQKMLAALDQPFDIESNQVHAAASIGISVFPEDGQDALSLLRFSDVAVKRLHSEGTSGYLFYSPEMNQRAKEQWQLEAELRHALVANELLLHYQPKVSLRSGRIVGAEALIRWRHPQRGMISPGKFIPVAEETGLILDIGNWVLEEACRQIKSWMVAGIEMPPIAVNLSARQFDQHLPVRLQSVLERHGVPPERLKLEITESLLVRGADAVILIMNELVGMGFSLAMDDFGTGYSSLANLKRFPITTLKIDRAFVIGVPGDQNDCAIARAIVTMGLQLRQEIVAEGIETVEQMDFLRNLGCDQLQGFLFSPGVLSEMFERMVREDHRLKLD
jgi:diguanylate cyclase (GGDEF)-like protein/PAS domain S-box-containing protein